jgi:hypothetical protein
MVVRVRFAFFWVGSLKALTPVRDSLDACHGGASAREDFGEKPERKHLRVDGQVRGLDGWRWMTPSSECLYPFDQDHEQERAHEEVGGDEKDTPLVLNLAHISQGEDKQDSEAEGEGIGFEPGKAEISAPTPAEMPPAALRM